MSRPVGPPPYTAEEIALLDTPEKRFIAQAELNNCPYRQLQTAHSNGWLMCTGYIMGHRMADLRDQGLVGAPTYNLTNINGAMVGFRRDSSPLIKSETPDEIPNEDQQPSYRRTIAGPHRGRTRDFNERALRAHRPYPAAASRNVRTTKSNTLCQNFTSTGKCARLRCPDIHDVHKLALCKQFLYKHTCTSDTRCSLSHEATPENTPHCLYFLENRCTNSSCMFAHVDNIDKHAPVCSSFGKFGYCDEGEACQCLHAYECPDFANTGVCVAGEKCSLKHVHHASRMKAAAHISSGTRSPASPASSVYIDGTDMRNASSSPRDDQNHAIAQQHDYIRFGSQD